jgi:hypothetical protein
MRSFRPYLGRPLDRYSWENSSVLSSMSAVCLAPKFARSSNPPASLVASGIVRVFSMSEIIAIR